MLGIQANGLVEVPDGLFKLVQLSIGGAPVVVGIEMAVSFPLREEINISSLC